MTPFPPDGVVSGATNTPNPNRDATGGVQAVSDDLGAGRSWAAVEALAALLEPEAFDDSVPWKSDVTREEYRQRALAHAASAIMAGYRRVAVDDDTIDRLAGAIAAISAPTAGPVDPREYYRRAARAVVRALREET